MNSHEDYIQEIEKESSTVGINIPETITIQGDKIPIKDIIFRISDGNYEGDNDLSPDDLVVILRKERNSIIEDIEDGRLGLESECRNAVKKCKELDRCIDHLKSVGKDVSIERQNKLKDAMREKKWREMIKDINL